MGVSIPEHVNLFTRWVNIQDLNENDTYRNGEVVHLSSIFQRIIFFFKELFSGGRLQNDHTHFQQFYSEISVSVSTLNNYLDTRPDDTVFFMVQTLLKIQAHINISGWKAPHAEYELFEKQISELLNKAKAKIKTWNVSTFSEKDKQDIVRWINSDPIQRQFAAAVKGDLPSRWDEIPKGAVILYNPDSWTLSHKLQNHSLTFRQMIKTIKTIFCKIFTGKVYTHAELSLGNGYTFDLDKQEGTLCSGIAKIQNRRGKFCFYDVIAPNQDRMVKAHNQAFPDCPVNNFDELWTKIEKEARDKYKKIRASMADIIRVVLTTRRPDNYDCKQAWNPGVNNYGCSATISALFGGIGGIDIGKQFNKQVQNISPADLEKSEFFIPTYILASR